MAAAPDPAEAAPRSRTRRMARDERRAAILAAARQEFAAHGFHGAGTATIARAAGCSEAILYRHFASKRALLAAVLRAEVGGRVDAARALAPAPGVAPATALPQVLRARLADGDLGVTVRLILLAISMSSDPEIGGAVLDGFSAIREPLRGAIAAGQADGSVRDDIDAEALTWLWHGLFLVAAVRDTLADDGVSAGALEAAGALARLIAPDGAGGP